MIEEEIEMQYMGKLADGTLGIIGSDTIDEQDANASIGKTVNVHTEVFPYRSIILSDPIPGLPH